MDRRLYQANLDRMAAPGLVAIYERLVDELGPGFLMSRPTGHGPGRKHVLRFSRGSWNPLDFIVNNRDLRCYFRAPLFRHDPRALGQVRAAFPRGDVTDTGDYAFNFSDMPTCDRLIRFVNEDLRNVIEARPDDGGVAAPVIEVSVDLQEDSGADSVYWEGDRSRALHERIERDRRARDECLRLRGNGCAVCGLRLRDRYTGLSREVIEVHHLRPVAMSAGVYQVNPAIDLIPVCPNCHRVIHTTIPPMSAEQARTMLKP
jgi:hypothetical protein